MSDHMKHLVIYWQAKQLKPKAIYEKCCIHFPNDDVKYGTIKEWCRRIKRGEDILHRKIGSGRIADELIDGKISQALEEMPFHSIRTLSTALKVPKSTVFDHITSMGLVVKHLKFVPHTLSLSQKVERVEISKQLLEVIAQARHQSWAFFLTGDESWFYFITDFETQWLRPDEKPSTRPRTIISTPKRMLTIFWSPLGFRIVEMLPQGMKFSAEYFTNVILQKITETHPPVVLNQPQRRVVIHMDNATPHRAKMVQEFANKNRLKMAPHPPYSPDLAPSDFYLFGKVKHALQGQEFESEEDLFQGIQTVLIGISEEELLSVMDEWERRLHDCISRNGDYVD